MKFPYPDKNLINIEYYYHDLMRKHCTVKISFPLPQLFAMYLDFPQVYTLPLGVRLHYAWHIQGPVVLCESRAQEMCCLLRKVPNQGWQCRAVR